MALSVDVEAQTSRTTAWLGPWISAFNYARKFCNSSVFKRTTAQSHRVYPQIEDYPSGYPRFSRLIGAHPAFSLFRRFSVVRARLLLLKQDRVCVLEKRLEELDQKEQRQLFLGTFRQDQNSERGEVLEALDKALSDYDAFVEKSTSILQLPSATKRNTCSLSNWVEGTGSISRKESEFLYERDLCTTESSNNDGLAAIECFVERLFIRFGEHFQRVRVHEPRRSAVSRDARVFIYTGSPLKVVTHLLLTWLIVVLLLVPVVILRSISSVPLQVFCIMIASGVFTVVLSSLFSARASEVFVAGATYAALLVIFISGSRNSN